MTITTDKASIDIDGEYDTFKLKIGCETNTPTQMKEPFKKYVLLGNCEEWDLSLLIFALINSAHNLLPKSTLDEERSLMNELRNIRNQDYGHIKECSITNTRLHAVKSAMMGFAGYCLPGSEDELRRDINRTDAFEVANISDDHQEDPQSRWDAEMSYRLDETNSKPDRLLELQHNSAKEEQAYDLYFVCQLVPNAVHQICTALHGQDAADVPLRCLEHQVCKQRLHVWFLQHLDNIDEKVKYKICFT